jgi:hypothetical protein
VAAACFRLPPLDVWPIAVPMTSLPSAFSDVEASLLVFLARGIGAVGKGGRVGILSFRMVFESIALAVVLAY